MGSENEEAVIYAWAKKTTRTKQGNIPSSWDRYDTEYGWTADDYTRAARGLERDVECLDISIGAFSINTGKVITVANRGKSNDKKTAVVLHASDGILFDAGEYGIYNTIEGKILLPPFGTSHYHPTQDAVVALAHKYGIVYFSKDSAFLYPYREEGPFEVKAESCQKISGTNPKECWDALGVTPSRAHPFGKSFEFTANGRKYKVDNSSESCKIVDTQGERQVLTFSGLILDVVGFPENIILDKFPSLGDQ